MTRSADRPGWAPRLAWAVLFCLGCAGAGLSPAISDALLTATSAAALVRLCRAGTSGDAMARSRRLTAGALAVGLLTGAVALCWLLVTGHRVPTGGPDDWLELCYLPFAVGALFTLPGERGGRARTIADATVAAASLWYVALILLPSGLIRGLSPLDLVTATAYLLQPAFILAVLLSVGSRVVRPARPFLLRIGAGLTLVAASQVIYAVHTWGAGYAIRDWGPVSSEAGLLLVLAAGRFAGAAAGATGPSAAPSLAAAELPPQPPPPRRLAEVLPYLPLAVAVGFGAVLFAQGRGITHAELLPVMLLGLAVVVRHVAALRDHAQLVDRLAAGERAARAEALTDQLTGLANRNAFAGQVGRLLLEPDAHPVAIALLDLNDFKDVNDTHGHATGDALLQLCAARLSALAPAGSLVARLGGDEFALCQPAARDGGTGLAAAVLQAFAEPLAIGPRHFLVRPSVGVVLDERPPGTATAADAVHLFAHADVAMYQAKADKDTQGAPAVLLTGASRRRAAAFIRLREEISQPDLTQFYVLYQPVVDLSTGAIRGAEALLRWQHPEFGLVMPSMFIPLAEQVGSVAALGEHVAARAAADLAAWQQIAPDRRLTVSVNLSPRQLADATLPARLLGLLAGHGLPADRLTLEITEGALVEDLDTAVAVVTAMHDGGLGIAVDDFGTGHSSLRYLRRFPIDVVKIDREFVQALPEEPRTGALVRSVVQMAGALGLRTVAEGIETSAQLRICQLLGAQMGQGFLFSAAVEAAVLADLVAAGHRYQVVGGQPSGDLSSSLLPVPRESAVAGTTKTTSKGYDSSVH